MSTLIGQKRAAFALEKVRSVKEASGNMPRDYRSLVEGFPALVRSAGLGQAVAMILEEKGAKKVLREHVQAWLAFRFGNQPGTRPEQLMQFITAADRGTYLAAQEETLAISGWLKTFSQAFLPEGKR